MAQIPSHKLVEWRASSILDPWPEDWQCIQLARLCAFVGNLLGGKGHGEAYQNADFLPTDEAPKEPREQTAEEQLAIFRALAAANQ